MTLVKRNKYNQQTKIIEEPSFMDILLAIVQLEKSRYKELVGILNESDLSKEVKWEIIDILDTAAQQTEQAKSMGWL